MAIQYENITFTGATPPRTANSAIDELKGPVRARPFEGADFKRIQLNADQQRYVAGQITLAQKKLEQLGIRGRQLPTVDRIVFYSSTDSDFHGIEAYARDEDRAVDLILGQGTPLHSKPARDALIHELIHYATRKRMHAKPQRVAYPNMRPVEIRAQSWGFTRDSEELGISHGLFQEALPDIFTAYCTEEEVETTYDAQTPFVFALILDLAKREKTSEMEVFCALLRAVMEQDYSYMAKLVSIYGSSFVKAVNRIEMVLGTASRKDLTTLATLGNFQESYLGLQRRFDLGEALTIEGLLGSVRSASYKGDRE